MHVFLSVFCLYFSNRKLHCKHLLNMIISFEKDDLLHELKFKIHFGYQIEEFHEDTLTIHLKGRVNVNYNLRLYPTPISYAK